jgi:hypothetical protein
MRKISAGLVMRVLAGSGIVACLALSGAAPAATAAPANATTARTVTAVTPAAATVLPAYTSAPGWLKSVSVVSANNAWAVGLSALKSGLIFHWNGKRWSYLNVTGYFNGVAARSATDVWAVGATSQFSDSQPLALHWNGRSWTRVPTPALKIGGYFTAVAGSSAGSVWAVGLAGPGRGGIATAAQLLEHWNGKRWTVQHFPSLPGGGQFSGVAALSAGNAWAVGSTGSQTLAEHWNGAKWSRWASPNLLPGVGASTLSAVTVIAANNAWAVGSVYLPDGSSRTLTAFWNGHRWRLVASPSRGDDAALFGVAASWTNNIWAVGTAYGEPGCIGESCGPFLTLIMHWNGTRWKVVPSPNPEETISIALNGVAAVTRDNIWAVGNANSSSTMIVHWNGKAWS